MLIITHPEEKEIYVAYFESVYGFGIGIGPVVGSLLYNINGFLFTFAVLSSCFIILVPFFIFAMPSNINKDSIEVEGLAQDRNLSDGEIPNIKI